MAVMESRIDKRSAEFLANREHYLGLLEKLREPRRWS
jgi:hypothetical protein